MSGNKNKNLLRILKKYKRKIHLLKIRNKCMKVYELIYFKDSANE